MADIRIPRIETLIITIFFMGVGLWAVNQCNARRTQMVQKVQEFASSDDNEDEIPQKRATPAPPPQPEKESPVQEKEPEETEKPAEPVQPKPKSTPGKRPELTNDIRPKPAEKEPETRTNGSTLYVTIEGLKVRSEPGLKGDLVEKLSLYDPVTFLNETTDWTQEINLGTEKVTDHWVKIRTRSGREGWVFGAGLHYFKMKRKGVL